MKLPGLLRRYHSWIGSCSLPCLILAAASLGCSAEPPALDVDVEILGQDEAALYGLPSLYWPTNSVGITAVPVCWLSTGYATEKQWVRSTVESQWGSYSSVRFTGWGACDASTPSYAIRIRIEDTTQAPRSYVGRVTLSPSMWLNFTFANWGSACVDQVDHWPNIDDREYCIRGVALHEFGHALGFFHEQDSPGNNGQCNESVVQQVNGVMVTEYDASSTMNYCADWGRNTLSGLDTNGLRKAYGMTPLEFAISGPLPNRSCTQTLEPLDPHTWNDNYLCSAVNQEIAWSYSGPIAGMRCTQILESSDPYTWNDNYACVPSWSPLQLQWSYAGPIAGQRCIPFNEPMDPHTWNDNYLCYTQRLAFSNYWPIAGHTCVSVNEPMDPHTWNDNYLCSNVDEGIQWSYAGPISGMRCTQILEPADPYTWSDNYICVPNSSTLYFQWSYAGPIAGKTCVRWSEPSDPHTWNDNYLCY